MITTACVEVRDSVAVARAGSKDLDLCQGSTMPNVCRNGPRPATHECGLLTSSLSEELPIAPP